MDEDYDFESDRELPWEDDAYHPAVEVEPDTYHDGNEEVPLFV